jgi:hypothetical protein
MAPLAAPHSNLTLSLEACELRLAFATYTAK